jgi:hypothetical protein
MKLFNTNLQPLTNKDLKQLTSKLQIKNFRGVFMRDNLPNNAKDNECGIINLDSYKNKGTHWTAYYKNEDKCYYFDSFGLDPPIELQKYLNCQIELSSFQVQNFNTNYCGHLCLLVLKMLEKYKFNDIILNFVMSMS